MKKAFTLCLSFLFLCLAAHFAGAQNIQQTDAVTGAKPQSLTETPLKIPFTGTYYNGTKSGLLYDNGPLVNYPGNGSDPDTSSVQTGIGLSSIALPNSTDFQERAAEDLTINDSVWIIDSIVLFGYSWYASVVSCYTLYNLQIWDGFPNGTGNSVVWGDGTTNRLIRSAWTRIYRNYDTDTVPQDTMLHIMRNVLSTAGLILTKGTYWLDWQSSATHDSYAPPITIINLTNTGNAKCKAYSSAWVDYTSGAIHAPQGLPFLVYGYSGNSMPDIGIMGLISPSTGVLSNTETVIVGLENYCSDPFVGYPIKYKIDSSPPISEINANTISGFGTQTYIFSTPADLSTPGPHTIKVWTELPYDTNKSNDTLMVIVNNTIGINEVNDDNSLMIYPNPADEVINISYSEPVEVIEIYDLQFKSICHYYPVSTQFSIPIEGWNNGLYTLRLISGNNVFWKKIIVE